MIAAAAMSLSSVCVVSNALRLRAWKPAPLVAATPEPEADATSAAAPEPSQGTTAGPSGVEQSDQPKEKEIVMEKTLHVEGMMCQHCVARVKKALEAVEGVEEAIVDLDAKTATAKLSADVADDVLVKAVTDQDYEAEILS